jgi:multidrug efflux pump subunit AcrB
MWIVKLALRRPYTFVVMAIAIVIAGLTGFSPNAKGHLPRN